MADNPDIVIGHDTPPPLDRVNPVHSFERGLDPWHEDAFPDEFKASAPNRGKRQSGWLALDWCGNVIGFFRDGTVFKGRTDG